LKILFITANRVGDAVLSTGLLAALIRQYPNARITIASGPYGADLFRAVPQLEHLIILKKRSWNRHWLGLWRECLGTQWDLIVDLRNSIVSRLLRAHKRAYHKHRSSQHKVIQNGAVLGLQPPPAPFIWLDANAEREAAKLLPITRPILALGPAANWPVKQWPIERFLELAQKLTAPDGLWPHAPVMVIGDEKERAQMLLLLKGIPPERRIEVLGKDLLTVAACLKQAGLFIGNDSGLMHMAAAVGTPTLGLFGPGYEDIYGPWGNRSAFVRTVESREELLSRLPDAHAREPNLMGGLSVERVLEAVKKLLAKTA